MFAIGAAAVRANFESTLEEGRKFKHFKEYSQGGCATETELYPRWVRKELAIGEKGFQSCLRFCGNSHGCLFFEFEEKTGFCHLHDKMITRSNGYPGVKCYRMVSSGPEGETKIEYDVSGLEDDSGSADVEYFTRNDEFDADLHDNEEIEREGQYNSGQEAIDEDFDKEWKNEENGSGSKQDLDAQLEYDYDNDIFMVQEHVQDDYDDEDQAGNYMDDDEYDDIETTTIGHSFVNQRHDTESSDDTPHDPEFLDRDYGKADEYIEEEPMIAEQPNTYSNVNILMDQDCYDNEDTTRTVHSFVNQSLDTEEKDALPRDPEFFDRGYENDPEVDKYTEEEPMITEQKHTYSDIHIRTIQKLSLLPEFMDKDYDNVFKSQNIRDTKDYALPISTGIFAFLAVIAVLITAIRCRSNNKSRSSAQPTTWDTQKAKELVPVIRGFHPKTAGGYENLCGMENSNCVLDEEDLMLKSLA